MTEKTGMSGDELARACADIMWSSDNASRDLGMEIISIFQGRATMSMMVTDKMTNGQKHCHGGYIFTLADSAFAFACNGYNQFTVAQHCSVSFLSPAFLGDQLVAQAREIFRQGRGGVYDVEVVNQDKKIIALFRGNSRTIKGTHVPGNEPARNTENTK